MVAALASRHQIRCVTTILLVLCEQPLPQTLHLTDCKSERQVKKSSCPKRLFVTKFLFFFFLTMDLYAYCHHGHARWYKSAQLRRWQCLQHSHMQPCWMLLCIFFHWHTNRLLFLEKKKKTQKKSKWQLMCSSDITEAILVQQKWWKIVKVLHTGNDRQDCFEDAFGKSLRSLWMLHTK